ncbi:MAG: TonB-dependent receptor, partial [Bacteroidota bacterium]
FATPMAAQVTGVVVDETENPIPFANVILLAPTDSSMVTGTTTDAEGEFMLPADPNDYLLRISAIGYADWLGNVFSLKPEQPLHFGRIAVASGAIALEALEVKACKLQLELLPQGTVVNVQSSVLTRGSSALQVLERSPGVFIDRRNNNISLNGRDGVTVLLNGKTLRLPLASLLGTLKGMRADNIEKIELLTSPGAKYDADGTAGLINIVLKRPEGTGTNGSISVNGGYGYRPKAGASVQYSRGSSTDQWQLNYAYNFDHSNDGYHGVGSNTVPALGGNVGFDFLNNVVHRNQSHQLGLGWERQLTELTVLGAGLQARQAEDRNSILNQAAYDLPADSTFSARINIGGRNRWRNLNPNLFLSTKTVKGGQLDLDANYLYFSNDNPTVVQNSFQNAAGETIDLGGGIFTQTNRGSSSTQIHIATLQADFSQPLSDRLTLETGIKLSRSRAENTGVISRLDGGEWQPDARTVSALTALETIAAGYGSFRFQLGERTDLTTATRFEYWDQQFNGAATDRRSGRFFPSLAFNHRLQNDSQWQFSYARRINRPSYNDLAAALTYSGLASVFSGNPLLRPTLSHQLRLGYAFGGKLLAVSWQRENNPIARFQAAANATSDLIVISPQNVDYQRNLEVQLTVPVTLTPWWSGQINATTSWRRFRLLHTPETLSHQYLNVGLNGSQTFTLPQKWTLELSGWYNSGTYNGSVELKSFGAISAGVKKELNGEKGSLQLVVDDLLKTSGVRFHYGVLGPEHYDISAIGTYLPEAARTRIIRLSHFRSFGGQADVKSRRATA